MNDVVVDGRAAHENAEPGDDAPVPALSIPAGLLAEFGSADALLAAATSARAAGFEHAEAYTPFPVDGLAEAVGFERSRVPAFAFIGVLVGGLGTYFLQWYSAVVDYPMNVGGRPLHSWPMFIPSTFEMAILGGAIAAVLAFIVGSGLPQLHHPLFDIDGFERASRDRFFLILRSDEKAFDADRTAALLDGAGPLRRVAIPAVVET